MTKPTKYSEKDYTLTPQELAEEVGVSASTLRRWESEGTIDSIRTASGSRLYSLNDKPQIVKHKALVAEKKSQTSRQNVVRVAETVGFSAAPSNKLVNNFASQIGSERSERSLDQSDQLVFADAPARFSGGFRNLMATTIALVATAGLLLTPPVNQFYREQLGVPLPQAGEMTENLIGAVAGLIGSNERAINGSTTIGGVLAASIGTGRTVLNIGVPTIFKNSITALGQNLDLGTGRLTASNVMYDVTAGDGIEVTGDEQSPTITNTGVLSINGQTGDATVALTAGDGVTVSGLKVTNSDRGSSQNIFKELRVGGSTLTASSNTDYATFTGTGDTTVSLSGHELAFYTPIKWTQGTGTLYATTLTDKIGIGTTSPNTTLDVTGTLNATGATTLGSSLQVTGATNLIGDLTKIRNIAYSWPTTQGGANAILQNDGSGNLSWIGGGSSGTIGYWSRSGGNVFPSTISDNVGIGTTSPQYTLDVAGTGHIVGALTGLTGLTSSGTITFSGLGTGVVHSTSGVLSSAAVNLGTEVTGTLPATNGGTGLSSVTEGAMLYASAANTWTTLGAGIENQVMVTNSNGKPSWGSITDPGGICPNCVIKNPNSTQNITPGQADATGLIVKQASGGTVDVFKVTDYAGTTSYFRIDSSGNVLLGPGGQTTAGILTVSPANTDPIALSPVAKGTTAYTGTITSLDLTANRTWTFPNATGNVCIDTGNCAGVSGNIGGSGIVNYVSKWSDTYMLTTGAIFDNGNVGIGTTTPATLFSVGTGSLFNVTSTGDVGIGTTAPSTKLEVAGTLRATGATTLTSTLNVSGATVLSDTLQVTSDTTVGGNLKVNGAGNSWVVGNLGIGTTVPATLLDVNSKFNVLSGGNVGVGTTAPANLFSVGAGSLFNVTSTGNVGIGTTSPGALWNAVTTATTGTGGLVNANALTSGIAFSLSSTSTVLSTGNLLSLDWSPSSAPSAAATGDLFKINIGANGANLGGNLLNLLDNGSSLFSVNQTQITSALPHSFTSAGDVSLAYDLVFTNPTSSLIKSSAPLAIESGELFNSSDLTLRTYNQGSVVVDASGQTVNAGLSILAPLLTSGSALNITPTFNGSAVTGYGIYQSASDATSAANTDYGIYNLLALTGNAAKNGIGAYHSVTSSSTTADTLTSASLALSATGAISTGTRTMYGLYNVPVSTGASSGGTLNLYGNYAAPSSTLATAGTTNVYGSYLTTTATHAADAGTVNQYGLYVANGTSGTNGTSTKYGLYVESPTGADTNYAAIFAGGNVGIGTTSPGTKLGVATVANSAISQIARLINTGTGIGTGVRLGFTTDAGTDNAFIQSQYVDGTNFHNLEFGVGGQITTPGSVKMVIQGNGNVGIGTTAPGAYKLYVNGDSSITAYASSNSNTGFATQGLLLQSSSASNGYYSPSLSFDVGGGGGRASIGTVRETAYGGNLIFKLDQPGASSVSVERMRITSAGNVGIGTTSPASKLDITDTSNTAASLSLTNNTATTIGNGVDTLGVIDWQSTSLTTGNFLNMELNALTSGKGLNLTSTGIGLTGDLAILTASGNNAGVTGNVLKVGLTGASALGTALNITNAGAAGSFGLRVNDDGTYTDSTPFIVDSTGNVGIGTTAPGFRLQVGEGSNYGWVAADGTWASSSDIRYKTNISDLNNLSSLSSLLSLSPIRYDVIEEAHSPSSGQYGSGNHIGFSAQEVETLFPELVSTDTGGRKGLNYAGLVVPLVGAVQEQQKQIDQISQISQINLISQIGQIETWQASASAELATLKDQVALLQAQASGSATVVGAQHAVPLPQDDVKIDSNVAIYQNLNVLGKTTVDDLSVTGKISAGLLKMDGLSATSDVTVDALAGTLKFQSLGLGSVDFFNGRVVIDKKGNVALTTGHIAGNSTFREATILPAGSTALTVNQNWTTAPTTITATASYNTKVWVESITPQGFVIKTSEVSNKDEKIYWLAIW